MKQKATLVEKDYSPVAPVYDTTRYYGRKGRFTSDCERVLLREALERFSHEKLILLDVACGTGHFTYQVADLFGQAVGVDFTLDMLRKAVGKKTSRGQRVSFVQGSALGLPIAPGSCDAVLTTRFLHLFPRQRHKEILEYLVPPLRPGGVLLVEHDSPFVERILWLKVLLRGRRKREWSSYHHSEQPEGTERLARWGISAPGLPTLSLLFPWLARRLSGLFVESPLKGFSAFTLIVYRKL